MRGAKTPPKAKYTKKEITELGFKLLCENGEKALTAREMAKLLNTSSCPIFTAFGSMEEFKISVLTKCQHLYDTYCEEEIKSGKYPEYKALGMAYIRLAVEQKNIFKWMFMRDRNDENTEYCAEYTKVISMVAKQIGLPDSEAERMHFEMWTFDHGIAVKLATSYLILSVTEISQSISDVYDGLKRRYTSNERNN